MTGNDKNAYNPPMKAYRFKCWAFNVYFEHIVNAENDEDAQHLMAEGLDAGKGKTYNLGWSDLDEIPKGFT